MDSKTEPTIQHMDSVSVRSSKHEESAAAIDREREDVRAFEERPLDWRTLLALLALALTYEACLFSFALPANILLTINNAVGPSADIGWMATSWSLASAVAMTIAGRCSDIFGRRYYFLVGNLLGVIGCAVAGSATNVSGIIIGATFTGLAAGLQQLSFAAANEIVPKKIRGNTLALMSLVSLPASSFGGPIGYNVVVNYGWQWTYHLSLIINGVAFIMILVCYWPPGFIGLHSDGKTRAQQFKELDFVGLLLFGGGLTAFLVGVGFGGNPYPWTSAAVMGPLLIGGVACFLAFPLWEWKSPDTIAKLCPPHLVSNVRGVVVPIAVSFVGGMALISTGILWPQQVQRLFTTKPESVGWYGLVTNCAATFGLMLGGWTFSTFRRTRFQFIAVVILLTLFLGLNATATEHTPVRAAVFVGLASAMIGAANCMGILITQLGARDEDIGLATGLVNSLRATGGAVGVAVYSSLLTNRISSILGPSVATAVIDAGLPSASVPELLSALPLGTFDEVSGATPEIILAALAAEKRVYSNAFSLVYCVTVAFGGLAIIAALFVANVDKHLTRQVNVRVDKPHLVRQGEGDAAVLSTGVQRS